jgi:hypothetical protein
MNTTKTKPIKVFFSNLYWLEMILIVILLTGAILNNAQLITIALGGLSFAFFLYAYKPLEVEQDENELFGFKDLLSLMILPKVIFIGCSISTVGLLFYYSEIAGHSIMLTIGNGVILISLLVLGILQISGSLHLKILRPVLLRALPILAINLYVLY